MCVSVVHDSFVNLEVAITGGKQKRGALLFIILSLGLSAVHRISKKDIVNKIVRIVRLALALGTVDHQ